MDNQLISEHPHISVVICTRNRCDQVKKVLESAAKLNIAKGLVWELILVDNGSTDATQSVAASFKHLLPIRVVVEAQAGLSNARNRGLLEARGDYICWTDDDVTLDVNWLNAYAQAFKDFPEASVFGGRIDPEFEGDLPDWWVSSGSRLDPLLGKRYIGETYCEITGHEEDMPFGANFALRRHDLGELRFDPQLGVGPSRRRLGEESTMMWALLTRGGKGIWVPGARVVNPVPRARLSKDYVGEYHQGNGETDAYLYVVGFWDGKPKTQFELLARTIRISVAIPFHYCRYRFLRISQSAHEWVPAWVDYNVRKGMFAYFKRAFR